MAYKIKDTPQKTGIMDEDELLSRKDRILLLVEENRTAILVGAVLFVVIVVALGGVVWFDRNQSHQALVLEGKAQSFYINRVLDKPDEAQEDLSQAAELYRQVLDQYPHTSSARRSLFFLGNTLMEQGDVKEATETYQQFIDQYRDDEMFLGMVYQRLGYAHLLDGDNNGAIEAFSSVLNLSNALNKDQVLFEMAKLAEAEEDSEKALSHYKQLIETYPASPYFNEASLHVKILDPEEETTTEEESTEEIEGSEKAKKAKEGEDTQAEEIKKDDPSTKAEKGTPSSR